MLWKKHNFRNQSISCCWYLNGCEIEWLIEKQLTFTKLLKRDTVYNCVYYIEIEVYFNHPMKYYVYIFSLNYPFGPSDISNSSSTQQQQQLLLTTTEGLCAGSRWPSACHYILYLWLGILFTLSLAACCWDIGVTISHL